MAAHAIVLGFKEKLPTETLPSAVGDIPRGALTEIAGPASSGRTSLLHSLLATASSGQEFCALLDAEDRFDPESAAAAGVRLSQVLWVRCGGNAEHALKAADMLSQAGGFGLVAIDLGGTPEKVARRIPLAAWFRLRQAVENTRTALVVVAQQMHARSCSALKIELRRNRAVWRGRLPGCILDGFEVIAQCTRNHRTQERQFSVERGGDVGPGFQPAAGFLAGVAGRSWAQRRQAEAQRQAESQTLQGCTSATPRS